MTTTELNRALKRLKASDTPRKRSNALKAFSAAVKALEADVSEQYPKLRADGTAIVRRKPRGAFCPACRIPFKTFRALADHVVEKHGHIRRGRWCVCDKEFKATRAKGVKTQVALHLAGLSDIVIHFANAAMSKAAGNT